jgi:hypothetical protein
MTDHSPSLLPTFLNRPSDAGHAVLSGLPLPAVSIPTFVMTKRVPNDAASEPMRRSALWRAAAGRWMNRSFDPAGAEAIRESVSSIPTDEDSDA